LYLGNLDSERDWGHARDYVRMQWMMLQQKNPEDFVIATGKKVSVRDFVILSAKNLGIDIEFEGQGINEKGIVKDIYSKDKLNVKQGDIIVRVDPEYYRPTEVEELLGDASKAKKKLGWQAEISVEEMCEEMIASDLKLAKKEILIKEQGFS
jgi:GDPmannose 4,6-dehydratase